MDTFVLLLILEEMLSILARWCEPGAKSLPASFNLLFLVDVMCQDLGRTRL
jgi:hypothetical protein